MIELLRSWVLNIVTLVLFIILLEILIPSKKFKKFISLISGFILIIAIIQPFMKIVDRGMDLKDFQMTSSNFIDKREIEASSKVLQEKQTQQIIEVYKDKIAGQVKEQVNKVNPDYDVDAEVVINENQDEENFGEIKRVSIRLRTKQKDTGIKPVVNIEEVVIETNRSDEIKEEPAKEEAATIDKETQSEMKESIQSVLGIQKENIMITMQED